MSLDKKLTISEIFPSIQGEGKYLGHPCIFIRTSGCNLRCQWGKTLCDTPYTSWFPESRVLTIREIIEWVEQRISDHSMIDQVVITGGEPLIQQNIGHLVAELSTMNFFVSIETNGSIAKPIKTDFVSISPKLKSSIPTQTKFSMLHEKNRYNKKALLFWHKNYSHQFKFVVNKKKDEDEILWMLSDLNIKGNDHIYLMPQGITRSQLATNAKKCVEISLRHGWKYTPRAHIDIFGNKRGV